MMTKQAREQQAEELRARLHQTQAEIDELQTLTEETIDRVRAELQHTSLALADAQLELVVKKAWEGDQR